MEAHDDDLTRFEAEGASLPETEDQGFVENDGALIWYAALGSGLPMILLHGGLGHGGNWAYQVPVLVENGYRVVVIDSRGHGHSMRDTKPYSYDLMATDVLSVMDALHVEKAALVGWSDGACTSLILAAKNPSRVAGVFFFACNMDPSGTKEFQMTPIIQRCFNRHVKDYQRLSPAPKQFDEFSEAVSLMQRTQPNYSAEDLAQIRVPVVIVQSEHDEFIKREHGEYLAQNIPMQNLFTFPVSVTSPRYRDQNNSILCFLSFSAKFNSSQPYSNHFQELNKKTPKVYQTLRVRELQEFYFVGAARKRLTRKITATNTTAIINKPGAPRSSAIPVFGNAVDVAMIV